MLCEILYPVRYILSIPSIGIKLLVYNDVINNNIRNKNSWLISTIEACMLGSITLNTLQDLMLVQENCAISLYYFMCCLMAVKLFVSIQHDEGQRTLVISVVFWLSYSYTKALSFLQPNLDWICPDYILY